MFLLSKKDMVFEYVLLQVDLENRDRIYDQLNEYKKPDTDPDVNVESVEKVVDENMDKGISIIVKITGNEYAPLEQFIIDNIKNLEDVQHVQILRELP